MAFGESLALLFRIKADGAQAKQTMAEFRKDFKTTESEIKSRGSALNQIFAGITHEMGLTGNQAAVLKADLLQLGTVAGIAAGAVTAIGAAAVGAGAALFELAKSASDYAGAIFDASQKTGLSAAVLTTLKYNAEAAGSSLNNIETGLARFTKLMGEAAAGSVKAQKTLHDLGITSTDLQTALDQAFKSISQLSDGTEQMAAAQKLFGRSGADLIPVIKQMNGDLEDSIETAKRFGITLTDADLRAADDFGDSLKLLGTQARTVATIFGLEVAPLITDAMKSIAKTIGDNRDEIRGWAIDFANGVRGVGLEVQLFAKLVQINFDLINDAIRIQSAGIVNNLAEAWNIATFGAHRYLIEAIAAARAIGGARAGAGLGTTGGGSGGGIRGVGGLSVSLPDFTGGGGGGSRGGGGRDNSQREAERAERERIQAIKAGLAQELAERSAADDVVLARIKADVEAQIITEKQGLEARQQIERDFLVFKIDQLQKELEAVTGNAKEEQRVTSEIKIANAAFEAKLQQQRGEGVRQAIKDADDFIKKIKEEGQVYIDQIEKENEKLRQQQQLIDEVGPLSQGPQPGQPIPGAIETQPGPFDGWLESWDNFFTTVDDQVGDLSKSLTTFADDMQQAFEGVAQAIGSVVQNWVLYGETGPAVLKKVLAASLASLAAEAAVWALKATALGFYYLALQDYKDAANAFISAGYWAAVAVAAGLAGRAIAGNSFKNQNGSANSSSSSNNNNSNANQNPQTYSRTSATAFDSGSRSFWGEAIREHTAALRENTAANERFVNKVDSLPPEHVVTIGIDRRPGLIGNAVHKDIQRDSSTGRKIGRAMGMT